MAFVIKETQRYTHPTEPDFWVEMSLPPSSGDLRGVEPSAGEMAAALDILSRVIKKWSDPRPVTKAAVDELDTDTFAWLGGIVRKSMGIDEEEKKDSASPSSRTTTMGARSRVSSST